MARSVWVEEVTGFDFNGDDAVVTLIADGRKLTLRGKRHTAVAGLALCARRYQELVRAENRVADIHPFKKGRRRGH